MLFATSARQGCARAWAKDEQVSARVGHARYYGISLARSAVVDVEPPIETHTYFWRAGESSVRSNKKGDHLPCPTETPSAVQ